MHRQIAGKLTGRVTKWIVLAFWLLAVVGAGGFAAKLTDVQNNEAASWLPANAESTRALDKLEPFQDPNAIPTVVVYEKKSGLSQADLAAATAQAADFQKMDGVEGKVVGPDPVEGRPGGADRRDLQLRQERLERHAGRRRHAARHGRHRRRHRAHRRGGRSGRRLRRGLRRPRQQPAVRHDRRGHPDPALHLPQPGAVDPPGVLGRCGAHDGPGRHLLPGQVRRPHRQRAEPGHPHRARLRRRHRLRAAARRPLPGGAPSPRRPARGDGLRAAPGHPGDHRQCDDRDPRHAVPAARRDELHRRPRPGGRHRHRGRPARDDHPAAGAARHHRPVDLLAGAAHDGVGRADRLRPVGQGRQPDRAGGRARSGSAPAPRSDSRAWASSPSTRTACRPRTSTPRTSTRSSASGC